MITLHSALTIAIAAKFPILLWGAPGSGKTSMITALAHDLDLPLEVVVGSIHEPSDFTGLPVVRETTTWFAPPHWAERLTKQGRGILFLDELTTAPPAVQAAMLRIVLEKTVGHLRLPPHVRIIAAANPPSVAADGWDLAAPLANRFIHLQWQPTAADIAAGFEALSWLKNLDLPDPQTILRDPDGVALPIEVDRLHALLSAVVAVAVTELEEAELTETAAHDSDAARETWRQAWRVIARVARTTPDVAATAAQSLAQHRPAGAPLPAELLELAPILRRAGLMP